MLDKEIRFTKEYVRAFLGYSNHSYLIEKGIRLRDFFNTKEETINNNLFDYLSNTKNVKQVKQVKQAVKKVKLDNNKIEKLEFDIENIEKLRRQGYSIGKLNKLTGVSRRKITSILYDIDKKIIEDMLLFKKDNGLLDTKKASEKLGIPVNLLNSLVTKDKRIYFLTVDNKK